MDCTYTLLSLGSVEAWNIQWFHHKIIWLGTSPAWKLIWRRACVEKKPDSREVILRKPSKEIPQEAVFLQQSRDAPHITQVN